VFQIYVMNADGTDVRQLTADSGANLSATCSPNGLQIVFNKLLPQVPGSAINSELSAVHNEPDTRRGPQHARRP
jgi:Tol biopolymer transport system component